MATLQLSDSFATHPADVIQVSVTNTQITLRQNLQFFGHHLRKCEPFVSKFYTYKLIGRDT